MKRWNIFARELEDILVARGLRLGHLDDRVNIHREKVRRLSRSLLTPKSFPVLNPDEMDEVIAAFGLNEYEVLRLRAAILTTAIEETLMDRVNQVDAIQAAEHLFPVILAAMQQYDGDMNGLDAVRGGFTNMLEETDMDLALETALNALDRATRELHLSRNVASHVERLKRARSAQAGFEVTLAELDEVDDEIKVTEVWHEWLDDAQKGLSAAKQRLAELGE